MGPELEADLGSDRAHSATTWSHRFGVQLRRNRGGGVVLEAGLVIGLTALTGAAYVWTEAPLFNPRGTIDPWLYTALWTNFDQIYALFQGTYYVSRIPLIVPGYLLNSVLDPRAASLVVHGLFFFGGGLLLYLLCRRFFGRVPAAMAYVGLVGNPLYFGAQRWDYHDGVVITLTLAAVYFGAPLTAHAFPRAISLVCAGFASAAVVTTQILALVYLVGLPLMYLVAFVASIHSRRLAQVGLDLAAYGAGCLALLGACGAFAKANGGPFLFFMPQVEAARTIDTSAYKQALGVWLPRSPWFIVPIFVVLLSSAVLAMRWTDRDHRRPLAGATAWLLISFCVLATWELVGDGYFLEYSWYVSPLLPAILLCIAGMVAVLIHEWSPRALLALVLAAALAVYAPLLWIYKDDVASRVADDVGREQYWFLLITMGVTAAVTALALFVRQFRRWTGVAAVFLALFASTYGTSASLGTFNVGSSDPVTGDLYTVGQDLIAYLHDAGFADALPSFWYDAQGGNGVHAAIQSLYYYGYSYVGVEMPTVDSDFRARMELFQPLRLVLLCESVACRGGVRALERAGYKPRLDSRVRLGEGAVATWVEIYRVTPPTK